MRKFLLLLAILALPGLAIAAPPDDVPSTVTVDLKAGDHGTGGVASLSVAPGVGGTIDLWMYITSDGDLDGAQWDIEVNGTNDTSLFSFDGLATPSADQYPSYPGVFYDDGLGEAFRMNDATYWNLGDYSPSTTPLDNSASEVIFKNTGFNDVSHINNGQTMIGYEFSWDSSLAQGDYTFSLGSNDKWTSQDASGNYLEGTLSGDDFVLTITPEPATVLLLLGALPFMRRRR
jgi:hypothetical protein